MKMICKPNGDIDYVEYNNWEKLIGFIFMIIGIVVTFDYFNHLLEVAIGIK